MPELKFEKMTVTGPNDVEKDITYKDLIMTCVQNTPGNAGVPAKRVLLRSKIMEQVEALDGDAKSIVLEGPEWLELEKAVKDVSWTMINPFVAGFLAQFITDEELGTTYDRTALKKRARPTLVKDHGIDKDEEAKKE